MIHGMYRDPATNTLVVALGVTPEELAGMQREGAFTVMETDLRQLPTHGPVDKLRLNVFTGADRAELEDRLERLADAQAGGCGECENCRSNAEQMAAHVVSEAEQIAAQAARHGGDD